MTFQGRCAFVAGAGGGMGLNIASDLIAAGADVVLADLKPRSEALPEGPGRHRYLQGDLSEESLAKEAVATALADFGRLDYLVNATGVLWFDRDGSFERMDLEVWDRVFAINLRSFVQTARHAVLAMRRTGGGAMVHISSIDALSGDPAPQDAYGAAKAAVLRLSKSIAVQCAKDGIRSNALLPGPVLSPMQARWEGKPEAQAALAGQIPLGRLGRTQDLADACLFLLSDKAGFITGTELIVDGGLTALP